ncbi:MAG TPA: hypothetical protein VEP73_04915 [Actinomycetota bacterium]|nr:hypothetical protein [Actinomycetota bacterium]
MHDIPCPLHGAAAAPDPRQRLSTHDTSLGTVVYYRCHCGRPALATLGRA